MPKLLPVMEAGVLMTAGVATGALIGAAAGAAAVGVGLYAWRIHRYRLRGRVVFISGGSRGLGFAIARECLRHGARVALCSRSESSLQEAAHQLGRYGDIFTVAADLTRPEGPADAVAEVCRHWGDIEVLIHNAGMMQIGPWDQLPPEEFENAMNLHCWAALRFARAVLPAMIQRGQGRIVNVASIGGIMAVPHMLAYSASKFALVGLSQGLAAEVRRHGVRVTCVCPFLTRTGSQDGVDVYGDRQREFAWFAASGSLPGLTQSASSAARSIIHACCAGKPLVVLTPQGKLAALAHGLAPGTMTAAMGVAERWLPHPQHSTPGEGAKGGDSYSPFLERNLKPLVHRAGDQLNQPGRGRAAGN